MRISDWSSDVCSSDLSPSEEFLPPTWARSVSRRSCSHRMFLEEARALNTGTPGCAGGGGKRGRAGEAGRSWLFSPTEQGSGHAPASRRALAPWPFPREHMGNRLRMSATRQVCSFYDEMGIASGRESVCKNG